LAGVAGVSGDMGADNDGENKLVCFTLTAGVDLGIDSADLDKVIRALGVWVTAWFVCWEGQGLWGVAGLSLLLHAHCCAYVR
jgi:hypothetical protein